MKSKAKQSKTKLKTNKTIFMSDDNCSEMKLIDDRKIIRQNYLEMRCCELEDEMEIKVAIISCEYC